jgi:hypothetical protein
MTRIVVNRNKDDLHVEDKLNRLRLRRFLQQRQANLSLSDRDLSHAAGHGKDWASNIWRRDSWRCATMQHIARLLGYELTFNVAIEADVAPPAGATNYEIYQNNPDLSKRDEATRIDLALLGARCREAIGITPYQLGRRLNMDGSKVVTWESGDTPYYMLVTAQRYFRALGGTLIFVLVAEDGTTVTPPATDADNLITAHWQPAVSLEQVNIVESDDRTLVWNSAQPSNVVSFTAQAWKLWLEAARYE